MKMISSKRLYIAQVSFTILTLLLQSFFPVISYAQSLTNLTTEEGPAIPIVEETIIPDESVSNSVVSSDINAPTTDNIDVQAIDPVIDIDSISLSNEVPKITESTIINKTHKFYDIKVDISYKYAFSDLSVTFSKLPVGSHSFSIEQIDIDFDGRVYQGYELLSDMVDGTFEYDLILPNTAGDDATVYYSEDKINYADIQENYVDSDSVSVSADHFTVFLVVDPGASKLGNIVFTYSGLNVIANIRASSLPSPERLCYTVYKMNNPNLSIYNIFNYTLVKSSSCFGRAVNNVQAVIDTTSFTEGKYVIDAFWALANPPVIGFDHTISSFVVDNTPPTVDLVFPVPGVTSTSFQAVFNEPVIQSEAENLANYFLNNWPTAGESGNLVGDATIVYDSATNTATITFTKPGWYISPEQQWGVQDIHDISGNLIQVSPYSEYSTPMVAPITTVSGLDSLYHNSDVTLLFNCTDINGSGCYKTYFSIDGASYVEGTSVTITEEGTHTISFYSEDRAGNIENPNNPIQTVNIDKTAPSTPTGLFFEDVSRTKVIPCGSRIQIQPVIPNWDDITGDPSFLHYEYTSFHPDGHIGLNETVFTTSEFVNNWTPPTDGAYGYAVRSVDNAGNKSSWALSDKTLQGSCQVIYDSVSPTATLSINRSLLFDSQRRLIVTAIYNEDMNTSINPIISFTPTVGTWTVYTAGTWINSNQYQIEYRISDANEETLSVTVTSSGATDIAGNTETASVPAVFAIDTKNPIISWTTPFNGQHIKGSFTLSATAFDAMSGINYARFRYKPAGSPDSSYITIYQSPLVPFIYIWDTTTLADGNYVLRLRGQDNATNFSLQHLNVVIDNTPPVLTLPADITVEAATASGTIVNYLASSLDAIDGALPITCIPSDGSLFPLGTTNVTCTSTDIAGNTSSGSFNVTVQDTTAPSMPTNIRFTSPALSCGGYTNVGSNTVDWDDSIDNVGVIGYDYYIDYPLIPSGRGTWQTFKTTSQHSGSLNYGLHMIKVRAKDAANNVSNWTPFCTITYDNIAPDVFITSPTNTHLTGIVPIRGTVLDDNLLRYWLVIENSSGTKVAGPGTVNRDTSFTDMHFFDWNTNILPDGSYTIKLEARDKAQNKDSGSVVWLTVIVDHTPPVINVPADITEEATSAQGAVVIFNVTATDNVDGVITPTCDFASGDTFPLGTTIVTCSATDNAGNIGSGSFTVTVEDTTGPIVTVPSDITEEAVSSTGKVVTFTSTATDNVDGAIVPVCAPPSGSLFPLGKTPVTCTATDNASNTGTGTFNVTIVDTTDPVFDPYGNIVLTTNSTAGRTVTYTLPTAQDTVDPTVVVSCNPPSGSTFPVGTTSVSCTAVDNFANVANMSFNVVVNYVAIAPVIFQVAGEETVLTPSITPSENPDNGEGNILGLVNQECPTFNDVSGYTFVDTNKNGLKDGDEKLVGNIDIEIYVPNAIQTDNTEKDTTIKTVKSDSKGMWTAQLCPGNYKAKVQGLTYDLTVSSTGENTNNNFPVTEPAGFNWWIFGIIFVGFAGILYFLRRRNGSGMPAYT